ncbi:MAG: phage tail tape measure protein [Anaerococcus prevotii]|uniref:phage tail tape measure protein n=1 Tax=Anaerococcus prevotii TaxID=33034 RepID=UPI0029005057|nr:phage tail tape measure protein [Anaerococcus prevotii]MDU2557414.1 phage tail tape measure protein [Anaerococcus prevotii]
MAYGNIKGITIEINGDTSNLTTALKNVDKEAGIVRKSLRDIQDSLKYDKSKGPELAAQKQRELARAIENTKEKLEILKKGQAEMSEEFKKTNEGSRAYDNLTREIDKTERQLKSFEAQADKTYQKLTKIRDSASNFGKAAQDVGSGLSKKITAPIIGAGGIVSKFAMDFDAEMSKVKAISGATGDDFASLEDKAREMGSKTKFSASEAAEALEYMAMAGWKPKEMLEGIEGVMNLAAASGEDLALTSDVVTDALTAFGLSAKDSTHFADVLAATSSNANTNVAMMGETFKYAAPIAGTLGYSVEDTALAIGLMANSGIKGSQAGTALRTGLTRLASPTKEVEKGMELLGLSMEDVQGKSLDETLRILRDSFDDLDGTQQTQAASMIFGQNAMSGMLKIIQASEGDYNKLSEAIKNSDGAANDMAATMQDNLGGDLEKLKSAAEELAISFGELLMPALRDVVDKVRDFIDRLNEMPDSTKQVILDVAAFAAVLGPIILIVGKISSGIGLIAGALAVMQGSMVGATPAMIGLGKMFSFIKLAFSGLKTMLLAHPIAAILIGVLTIAIPLIIKNWDSIKEFLVGAWENIKEIASNVWTGIAEFFSNIWNGVKEAWAAFWDPIGAWMGEKIQAIVDTVKPIFDTFINVFKVGWMLIEEIFKTAWEIISGFFRENWMTLVEIAKMVFNPLKDFITSIWEGIKTATMSIWNSISGWIKGIWQGILDFARPIFDGIKNFISGIWEGIKTATSATWNGIKSTLSGIWQAISNFARPIFEGIKNFISGIWQAISATTANAWNGIKNTTTTIWNGIKSTISSIWEGIKSAVSSAINSVSTTVSNVWNGIKNTTVSVWNGIKNSITGPINAARDAVGSAIDRIKSFFNINLSFPHIRLPHFSISGGFSLNPPSVPHFGIEWYKKGGIFTKPTIFNTPYGMKGVGEAGAEAVLPIDRLSDLMAKAMDTSQSVGGVSITGNTFVVRQEEDIEAIARKLYRMIESKKRGVGLG